MLLTFLLGSVFLGVKAYEYQAKFAHGIYPQKPHGLIYDKADIHYSAAVRKRLLRSAKRKSSRRPSARPKTNSELAVIDQISRDLVEPAETAIRDDPDSPRGPHPAA